MRSKCRPAVVIAVAVLTLILESGSNAWGTGPGLTTISDTVYRADGSPAGGTALISWPTFVAVSGDAVAAGQTSVRIGAAGALSTQLTPNAGASPEGTYYTVVFQLDDGTVRTEYWAVPTNSPVTIAQVRTTPGSGITNGFASQQYVQQAVANRALDTSVVHLGGAETVSGAKQFASSPSVPAPVGAGDAANKGYVDQAVANVGAGNFVAKTGDTMSGPLYLPADPTAPNQATDMHFVNLGLAGKANLVNGIVPTNQLGTGSANGTACLHGDSTWGGCGTSSNAIAIQGVPVATTAPTDGQVITYQVSSGSYVPLAGGNASSVYATTKYAADYQFSLNPTTDLSSPGAKTVTLTSCPAGARGNESGYWVYISGTGMPEAVLVTGGTCVGDGKAGTLQFATVNGHSAGYTITSASGGIAEASIASRYKPKGISADSGGLIIAPAGDIAIYGQLTIKSTGQTIQFTGGTQACYSATTPCVFIGDATNSSAVFDVTIIGFRGRPMVANGQQAMIEVNAQKTRIIELQGLSESGNSFGSWIKVDDDQAFLVDALDTSASLGPGGLDTIRCDSTFCGAVIWANGSFTSNPQRAPVGWIKNSNFNLQCGANGIDWQSGNTLRVSDTVIEGYPQYGIRYSSAAGGYGGLQMENVYEEYGSGCGTGLGSPSITSAAAGVIIQTSAGYTNPNASIRGGEGPSGNFPVFATGGSTQLNYYVVAIKSDGSRSVPLLAGTALPVNSGVSVPVKWYDLSPSTAYDLLVVTGAGDAVIPPYGTGNYAVATGIPQSSTCSNGVCSYSDGQSTRLSYTMGAYWLGSGPSWAPKIDLWPGSVILSPPATTDLAFQNHPLLYTDLYSSSNSYVSAGGGLFPQIFASHCAHGGPGNSGYNWPVCLGATNPWVQTKYLAGLEAGGSSALQHLKGTLNLGYNSAAQGPTHLITLFDYTPEISQAYGHSRAPNSPHDTFIGIDSSNTNGSVGLSFGSYGSISHYIGNTGDGTNWKERLTGSLKEFNVPVKFDQTTTFTYPISASITGNAGTATALAMTPTQCSGSFATGIAANGNANCTTPNVIQLAETTQPPGIPNWGIFWFDAATHTPRVLENNGQPIQLGLSNLFNSDPGGDPADNLEERSGTTAQNLRVYSSYTNNTTWTRMSLGVDSASGYQVLRSEDANSGNALGIGMYIGSGLKWAFASNGTLKPNSDNAFDIGSDSGQAMRSVFAKTSFNMYTQGRQDFEFTNDGTSGTTLNYLAVYNSAGTGVQTASTASTDGVIGIVSAGAGTDGKAVLTWAGVAACNFDAANPVLGNYVVVSTTQAGKCHDTGSSTRPTGVQAIGRIESGGVRVSLTAPSGGGGGAVASVFGRTGNVIAQSGDYSVSQITGAAPSASPSFT